MSTPIELLEAGRKAGEHAALMWYASDQSDGPEPSGRSRIVVTDPTWAARFVELGEATRTDEGAQLHGHWERDTKAVPISFAQHHSRAFAAHLTAHGATALVVDEVSGKLDTKSLKRGLDALAGGHMACISVETYHHPQKLWLTKPGEGPFVLQLIRGLMEQPTAETYLAAARERGLEVREADGNTMIALGADKRSAVDEVLFAIEVLLGTRPTTVVARFAPVTTGTW